MAKLDWTKAAAPRQASLRPEHKSGSIREPKWIAKAHGLLAMFERLSASEKKFIEAILARPERRLTERQSSWLEKIAADVPSRKASHTGKGNRP